MPHKNKGKREKSLTRIGNEAKFNTPQECQDPNSKANECSQCSQPCEKCLSSAKNTAVLDSSQGLQQDKYAGSLTITNPPLEDLGNINASEYGGIETVSALKTDIRKEQGGGTSNNRMSPAPGYVTNIHISSTEKKNFSKLSHESGWSVGSGPGGAVRDATNSFSPSPIGAQKKQSTSGSNPEGPPCTKSTGQKELSNNENLENKKAQSTNAIVTFPENDRTQEERRKTENPVLSPDKQNPPIESWTYTPHEKQFVKDDMESPSEEASNGPETQTLKTMGQNMDNVAKVHQPSCSGQGDHMPGPKSTNILLLGETGVGKTTFINSLVNNLKHKTLESMLNEEPRILVDTTFTLSDENYKKLRVNFPANYSHNSGISSTNEHLNDKGESATQGAVTYYIDYEDATGNFKFLNIIDTPGMSDTRGEKQDKENFEKILRCIKAVGELHAICIVMKPNQARFSLSFRYNIEGFLTRLHRDAAKNILFCFTNTRSTLYRPGDTLTTLQAYLDKLEKDRGILIRADKHNIFCFDNDCFRYVLAAKKGAYERTKELDTMFSESWERNVDESRKLLARAERLPIHNVQDTLNINRTQQLVTILAKPLAEIARNHLLNMRHTEDYMKQINGLSNQQSNLRSQIKKTIIVLEPRRLHKPRTICRNCTVWYMSPEFNELIPKYRVCHDKCYSETSPHDGYCKAFYKRNCYGDYIYGSHCVVCGCHRSLHEHQFYENVKIRKEVVDRRAQDEYHDAAQRMANRKKMLEEEKEKYKSLEFEHDSIRDFCAEATVFLLENSIKSIGDPYLLQIQNLIQDEESKMKIGGDSGMYYELSTLLEQYKNRVKILQEDIQQNRRVPLTCDELLQKMDNLAIQPHCGEQVRQLKAICEEKLNDIEEKAKTPNVESASSSVHV